ncbi:DUF4230 domain-containing protein [Flavimarina sp. Hel_I_48]|uniref:DUF4230 domain-containing protein n=1 Tax=Flavimarina sp. Hel_I_48 TaxID=1392488 RepID=UPI0004DFCC32|nr:DUF4230 domain-containing protein [Flavimarina sp. Hel_I_48]
MRKIILGIFIALIVVFAVRYFADKEDTGKLTESSALIEKQIKNVGKLVVTEGSFSQVFTYENSKKFYLDVFSARKKALIIVNAKVAISYDLRKLKTEMDANTKTIRITYIPEPEININPDIEYYDVKQDYLNKFEAKDYNTIKKRVDQLVREKIDKSNLKRNAANRLISELSNIYLLTNSLDWTLMYNGQVITQEEELKQLVPNQY